MALFLDSLGKVLACEKISEGIANATTINVRRTVELCVKYNATSIMLCHNHPSGSLIPSIDDFTSTKNLNIILHTMNCHVKDHIIIAKNRYVSMASMDQFKNAFELKEQVTP